MPSTVRSFADDQASQLDRIRLAPTHDRGPGATRTPGPLTSGGVAGFEPTTSSSRTLGWEVIEVPVGWSVGYRRLLTVGCGRGGCCTPLLYCNSSGVTYVGVPVTPIALPSAWSASTIRMCRPSNRAVLWRTAHQTERLNGMSDTLRRPHDGPVGGCVARHWSSSRAGKRQAPQLAALGSWAEPIPNYLRCP